MVPILLKTNGKLFPAPTQLLPEVGNGTDGLAVLDSLSKTLQGIIPDQSKKLVTTSETFNHRQYRQATRNLLVGLANALVQVMPVGWKMSDFKPEEPLTPCGSLSRESFLQQELMLLKTDTITNRTVHFLWSGDGDALTRKIDFYINPCSFYRLCFSGDEGTDVSW